MWTDRVVIPTVPAKRASAFIISILLALPFAGCDRTPVTDLPSNVSEITTVTPREGKSPGFSWNDADGDAVKFDEFRGKITLVNFWATWCAPCKKELPDLIELHRKYTERGFKIIGISTDRTPNALELVSDFVKEYKVPYQIVMSTEDVENAFGNVRMMPTTFLVDADGNIVQSFVGFRTLSQFEEAILPHLP